MQRAKLLTLLVEFNPNANDDFSGWERPYDPADRRSASPSRPAPCSTAPCTTRSPTRRTVGRGTDNNTFWVPDFSPGFYQQADLLHRRRPADGSGPTSTAGSDISGRTVKNYYLEMSKGRYVIDGRRLAVADAAALRGLVLRRHLRGRRGQRRRPPGQPARHRPDGHRRRARRWPTAKPDFPWADYDVEDQGDLDDDGNCSSPTARWTT